MSLSLALDTITSKSSQLEKLFLCPISSMYGFITVEDFGYIFKTHSTGLNPYVFDVLGKVGPAVIR